MSKIRLQVALAKAGISSRRKAVEFIEKGRVRVNEKTVREKGFRVDAKSDKISIDGKTILPEEKKCYCLLNKPAGVLSTARDERLRKTVLDYVKLKNERLYPVGRLDKDTTGLIILTNDGDLTYRLTHPKFGVRRAYLVKVKGGIDTKALSRLKSGVTVDGRLARAEKVFTHKVSPDFSVITLMISEGRKREVRNMLKAVGHDVLGLKRVSYGPLKLGGLKEGKTRMLTKGEVARLKESVGLR